MAEWAHQALAARSHVIAAAVHGDIAVKDAGCDANTAVDLGRPSYAGLTTICERAE